ncbi:MAG: hypothetical protein WKF43_03755 [Acidimicrobiales bacterium]
MAVLVLRAMAEWRTIEHTGDPRSARAARDARANAGSGGAHVLGSWDASWRAP